jgi:hypothetical protein
MAKTSTTDVARSFHNNCAINEETADGVAVGRCWFYLTDGKTCPRHGDVSLAMNRYRMNGRLTRETVHASWREP